MKQTIENPDGTKTRLNYLDNMRAGAIIMVVVTHSLGYCGDLNPAFRNIVNAAINIAVPVFFLADGYLTILIHGNREQFSYNSFVRKSFRRLLIPWLIFTILYAFARYLFEYTDLLNDQLIVHHSFQQILKGLYGSVYAPHLYFLFSLFLIRLWVPLLLRVVNYKPIMLCLVFIIYLSSYKELGSMIAPFLKIQGGLDPILHALWGAQFFLLGALLRLYENFLRPFFLWIIPVAILVIILLNTVGTQGMGKNFIGYAYLMAYFSTFFVLRQNAINFSSLGRNTMGIYLLHTPVLMKAVSLIISKFVSNGALSLFLISFLCLMISYQISLLIGRRHLGKILFGLR